MNEFMNKEKTLNFDLVPLWLPILNQVGSKRGSDLGEVYSILPYLGSGPFPTAPGSGFYTNEDYRDILRHAKSRFVDVIPEIDLPGHSHAAIRSMEARFRKFVSAGNPEAAMEYLLSDPDDQSDYEDINYLRNTTVNLCMPAAARFARTVAAAIKDVHKVGRNV